MVARFSASILLWLRFSWKALSTPMVKESTRKLLEGSFFSHSSYHSSVRIDVWKKNKQLHLEGRRPLLGVVNG